MISGVGGVSIWSSDLNNLLPFYRDVLGLKVGFESERFVMFGDPNSTTLALGSHSELRGPATDPYRHMFGLMSDDVMADAKRLKWSRRRTTRSRCSGLAAAWRRPASSLT